MEKHDESKAPVEYAESTRSSDAPHPGALGGNNNLKRRLGNRQIQLIAIGGSIGTAVFVSIASGLSAGGPASLLLAWIVGSVMLGLFNNSVAEMVCYMPISGSFIRMAGHWVDDALGALSGWNFFIYEAVLIPFEISALVLVLQFWSDHIPAVAIVIACLVLYALINIVAVNFYGESEFWLALGKLLLFFIVFFFTLVTMCGGNPKHDAYGFRFWYSPGAFAESVTTGSLGQFEGFLATLWNALFAICGPEYIAMVSGESRYPRKYIKSAFKTTFGRLMVFFVGSAICVGVVCAYNDPLLLNNAGSGNAASSPYVIAMYNLGIGGLPHLTNALLVTSIFSAGNAYTYCGSRSLYGLALDGKAPKIFAYATKNGVPVVALAGTLAFGLLGFLCVSSSSAKVLNWLIDVLGSSQLIGYIIICITYLRFHKAMEVQGFNRKSLPYVGWFQPYGTWIVMIFYFIVIIIRGYVVFIPGQWDIATFFTTYTMVGVCPLFFICWKLFGKTKTIPLHEVDLVWQAPSIDAYESMFVEDDQGFWTEIAQMFGFRRRAKVITGEE